MHNAGELAVRRGTESHSLQGAGPVARHHDDPDHVFRSWSDLWLDPAFVSWTVESDLETGGRFLARFHDLIDEEAAGGRLPEGFAVSAGLAAYPNDAVSADSLFRLADERLYETKRAKAVD